MMMRNSMITSALKLYEENANAEAWLDATDHAISHPYWNCLPVPKDADQVALSHNMMTFAWRKSQTPLKKKLRNTLQSQLSPAFSHATLQGKKHSTNAHTIAIFHTH